jgi:hypothetical protein
MCTVTFIPQQDEGFILTSNRDENAARSPQNITEEQMGENKLIFPRDTAAGGTWIAASNSDKVVCLLNGAFVRHKHEPPYRRSRGLMVLDFFEFKRATDFFKLYKFEGMEPFTMVIYDFGELFELRWDGALPYVKQLDMNKRHIWSSATLYDKTVTEKREKWFADWLEQRTDFSLEAILGFHQNAGDGDPENDVIMNRKGLVQTVSITQIVKQSNQVEMIYRDLLNIKEKNAKILLKGEVVGSR